MRSDKSLEKRSRRHHLFTMVILGAALITAGCGDVASVEGIGTGGTNSLMLSWNAPSTNEDGSPCDDLAGYKLYYGTQSGQYSNVVNVGDYTTAEVGNLADGTWYVTVTAYDMYGNESDFSNEINHTFF